VSGVRGKIISKRGKKRVLIAGSNELIALIQTFKPQKILDGSFLFLEKIFVLLQGMILFLHSSSPSLKMPAKLLQKDFNL